MSGQFGESNLHDPLKGMVCLMPGHTEKANKILREGLRGMKPSEIMGHLGSVCKLPQRGAGNTRRRYKTVKPKYPSSRQRGGVSRNYVLSWIIFAGLTLGAAVGAIYVLSWLYPVCENLKNLDTSVWAKWSEAIGSTARVAGEYAKSTRVGEYAGSAASWVLSKAPAGLIAPGTGTAEVSSEYAGLAKECITSHFSENQFSIGTWTSLMSFFGTLGSRSNIEKALDYLAPGGKADVDKITKGDKKSLKRVRELRERLKNMSQGQIDKALDQLKPLKTRMPGQEMSLAEEMDI